MELNKITDRFNYNVINLAFCVQIIILINFNKFIWMH